MAANVQNVASNGRAGRKPSDEVYFEFITATSLGKVAGPVQSGRKAGILHGLIHDPLTRERLLLTKSERGVLETFRRFLMTPGVMLCFNGPHLSKHSTGLRTLTEKGFLVKESFRGGYSLTQAGYNAMRNRVTATA
jgi:hypothetical protein